MWSNQSENWCAGSSCTPCACCTPTFLCCPRPWWTIWMHPVCGTLQDYFSASGSVSDSVGAGPEKRGANKGVIRPTSLANFLSKTWPTWPQFSVFVTIFEAYFVLRDAWEVQQSSGAKVGYVLRRSSTVLARFSVPLRDAGLLTQTGLLNPNLHYTLSWLWV